MVKIIGSLFVVVDLMMIKNWDRSDVKLIIYLLFLKKNILVWLNIVYFCIMCVYVFLFLGLYLDCSYKYIMLNVDDIIVYVELGVFDVNKIYF